MSDADLDLDRRVPAFGGREMPIRALLDMVTAHEIHHKDQVWMMARMVGVQPPMLVKMGEQGQRQNTNPKRQ